MAATPRGLPFAHLNLRRNPFGELDQDQRSALVVAELDDLPDRLSASGFAVQFLGPSGRGKTSRLLALRERFEVAPFRLVERGWRERIPVGSPLFLDDAHLLPRLRRALLFRRRRTSFALATHVDLAGELESAGLRVTTIRPGELVDAELLERIVERRLEAARRAAGPIPTIPQDTIERLLERFGNDLRAIERELYRRFQNLQEVSDVGL